jgi:hypothetical protein
MAKVSRSALKSIVKECLVELLAEGLTGGDTQELNESISVNQTNNTRDNIKQNKVKNKNFEDKTQKIIDQATSDPIMAGILADTAKTTLQEQADADRSNRFTAKPKDAYSQLASESDPMELFSGTSSNWAKLAFSDKQK